MSSHYAPSRIRPLRRAAGALAVALAAAGGAAALAPGAASAASRPAAATSYTFKTLDDNADPTFNQLLGINSHNVIAGYYGSGDPGHPNKGYLLKPPHGQANYVSENFPGSAQTQVVGLNNIGDTAGFWVDGKGTNRGFVEWNGVFTSYTDPSTPKANGAVDQLLGVNDKGLAVGFYNDAKGNSHAYKVQQGTRKYVAIKIPGASSTAATGINDAGAIVGTATAGEDTYSWLLAGGHLTALQFPGGSDTQAFGINSKDQIVGSYNDGAGVDHGFVLSTPLGKASWQKIDDPNGVGSTVVNGISAAGDLVGFYTDAAGNFDGMLATP